MSVWHNSRQVQSDAGGGCAESVRRRGATSAGEGTAAV
jgi:hypothetical protein